MAKKEKEIYDQLVTEGKCPEKIVYKEGTGYVKERVCNMQDIKSRMQQTEAQEIEAQQTDIQQTGEQSTQ